MIILIILSVILLFATWFYFFLNRKYSYWSSRGVANPRPVWPIGNVFHRFNTDFNAYDIEMVAKYGTVYGTYLGWRPSVVVAEPELVKQILIKDFHLFIDRINPKAYHEMWNTNLFAAKGDDWKRVRTITSPTFSSGKLKGMSAIMHKCIANLDEYFARLIASGHGTGLMDTKRIVAGFTLDVVASTSFATDTNANKDPNSPFLINGRNFFDIKPLRAMSAFLLPTRLLKLLGIQTAFSKEPFDFFVNLTSHIVEQRVSGNSGRRADFVQLLLDAVVDEEDLVKGDFEKMTVGEENEAQNDTKSAQTKQTLPANRQTLTKSEIIANCILFMVAGFETTASAISHCLFALAQNPQIQERLHDELCGALDPIEGGETSEEYFNAVMSGIPYLEAVVKETLRRFTPLAILNRICSQDGYKLGEKIELQKGSLINIPMAAIHMNPKFHPEPKVFNPERFMPQNKGKLVPYSYLPFSLGPRNCIAMRFAYQEIHLCLAGLLRKYRFSTTAETPAELTYTKNSALLIAKEFQLKVSKRERQTA